MPRNRPRGLGQDIAPGSMIAMPKVAPYYVRSRREPAEAPLDEEAISGRISQDKVEDQWGLQYLRRKKLIKGFNYTVDGAQPFNVPAGGARTATVTINREADWEMHKICATVDVPGLGIVAGRNDDFTFRIRDDRKGLYLSNNFIHNIAGTGSGLFPLVLPDTNLFKRGTTFSIDIQNRRAAQAIDIWWNFDGKNYYAQDVENLTDINDFERLSKQEKKYFLTKRKRYITPFMYTMDGGGIAVGPGATLQDQILTVQQAGDFEIFAWSAFSTNGPFTWVARESNTGRFLQQREICSASGMGDGERPHVLPEPFYVEGNGQLLITFRNLNAVATNTIFLTLIGRSWWDTSSLNLTIGPEFYCSMYDSVK